MSLWQENKEKSGDWQHSTGRTQVCLSFPTSEPGLTVLTSHPYLHLVGQIQTGWEATKGPTPSISRASVSEGQFLEQSKCCRHTPPPDRKLTFVSVVTKNAVQQTAHLRGKLRDGERGLTLQVAEGIPLPRSQNGTFSSYILPWGSQCYYVF